MRKFPVSSFLIFGFVEYFPIIELGSVALFYSWYDTVPVKNAVIIWVFKAGICNAFHSHTFLWSSQFFFTFLVLLCMLLIRIHPFSSFSGLCLYSLFLAADPFLFQGIRATLVNAVYLFILLLTEAVQSLGPCRNSSSYHRMVLALGRICKSRLGDVSVHSFILLISRCHTHLNQLRVLRSRRLTP